MKSYKDINITYKWQEIVPEIESEQCVLLNKGNDDFILAWGIEREFIYNGKSDLSTFLAELDAFENEYKFGYFGYDLKNHIEPRLQSKNPDRLEFHEAWFFIPKHIVFKRFDDLIYYGSEEAETIESLFKEYQPDASIERQDKIDLIPGITQQDYIRNLSHIKDHIQRGDIYEMNYCINFSAKGNISPLGTFLKLNKRAEAPFSVYANLENHAIISASPERFIHKTGNKLISQPIKGTARRDKDATLDAGIAETLQNDEKEVSENVMIVDLVRNDLSKIAVPKSVTVDSLCEVKTFKTVHQLVSTVSCEVSDITSNEAIIRALFPMGSMTGAPKISAMDISERYETFKRGLYSGTIGYFDPNGNFDFNVVIRSILYNKENSEISCSVGGAITAKSDPQKEYQECILKLEALKESLC